MKETGLTRKRRSTTIAATPDDGKSQRKRRSRGGASGTIIRRLDARHVYTDFGRATITRDIFVSGPMRLGLSRSLTNRQIQHFAERITFAEHGKVVAEFNLTLRIAHRTHFSNSKYARKAGHEENPS